MKPAKLIVDRAAFERDGYVIVHNVLSADEVTTAQPIFDAVLPAVGARPGVTNHAASENGRRSLGVEACEPQLSNIGFHPRLNEAVAALIGPTFLVHSTSIPVVTYKSPPGAEDFGLGYHVDWPNRPPLPGDEHHLNGAAHFSTMQPGGGALKVCPGSHRFVTDHLDDPSLRQRMIDQDFSDIEGLADPVEAIVPAGAVVFFHSFLVHDRSENVLDTPRKVVFVHYKAYADEQAMRERKGDVGSRFSDRQIATMTPDMRVQCGLD